jgi:hypothetical protein
VSTVFFARDVVAEPRCLCSLPSCAPTPGTPLSFELLHIVQMSEEVLAHLRNKYYFDQYSSTTTVDGFVLEEDECSVEEKAVKRTSEVAGISFQRQPRKQRSGVPRIRDPTKTAHSSSASTSSSASSASFSFSTASPAAPSSHSQAQSTTLPCTASSSSSPSRSLTVAPVPPARPTEDVKKSATTTSSSCVTQ